MKIIFFIPAFLLTILTTSLGQDFRAVDRHATKAPRKIAKDIHMLTDYLIKDYQTDLEKIRSFYIWIANNIIYDRSAYKGDRKRINRTNEDVLDRRQAVCYGYSSLFKEMCDLAGIRCEIIYGYPKDINTNVVDYTIANHAWNAVQINGKWELIDITWGTGNKDKYLERYFLMSPEEMILTHLPADPMWQLLDCPIDMDLFKQDHSVISAHLIDMKHCYSFQDSIAAYFKLPRIQQRLIMAHNMYRFNPVKTNEKELGHTYMDYVAVLSDRASVIELSDSIEAIKDIHLKIIATCQKASRYIELYDHQKENLAYSHLNYAVALSKELETNNDPNPVLEEMNNHLKKARNLLLPLKRNVLLENALNRIDSYIQWVEEY